MRMVFPNGTSRMLDELSSDVNKVFESIMGESAPTKSGYAPSMDFEERDDAYELSIDIPGMTPADIHVDVEDDHVVIHGSREAWKTDDTETRRRIERHHGEFRRAVRLPKAVDRDNVSAKYEHGVLNLVLPKATKNTHRVTVT